jgi:hypothetical protein
LSITYLPKASNIFKINILVMNQYPHALQGHNIDRNVPVKLLSNTKKGVFDCFVVLKYLSRHDTTARVNVTVLSGAT